MAVLKGCSKSKVIQLREIVVSGLLTVRWLYLCSLSIRFPWLFELAVFFFQFLPLIFRNDKLYFDVVLFGSYRSFVRFRWLNSFARLRWLFSFVRFRWLCSFVRFRWLFSFVRFCWFCSFVRFRQVSLLVSLIFPSTRWRRLGRQKLRIPVLLSPYGRGQSTHQV